MKIIVAHLRQIVGDDVADGKHGWIFAVVVHAFG